MTTLITPSVPHSDKKIFASLAVALVLWLAAYHLIQPLANWISFDLLKLSPDSQLGESLAFFLYDVPKILLLLSGMVFLISIVRTFFSPERTRALLGGKREGVGNIFAAMLGIVTPFCSCSAVPLFIGFVEAGIPLGVTFSLALPSPSSLQLRPLMKWRSSCYLVCLVGGSQDCMSLRVWWLPSSLDLLLGG